MLKHEYIVLLLPCSEPMAQGNESRLQLLSKRRSPAPEGGESAALVANCHQAFLGGCEA